MTIPASTFHASQFDYNEERDEYVAELAELSRKVGTSQIARMITISGRHYRLEKTDKNGGDIAGWWYHELGGRGRVLIIND